MKPTDPATLTAVTVFIAVIAFIACYVPAAAGHPRGSDGDAERILTPNPQRSV